MMSAFILRKVARATLDDARAAWKKARDSPTERYVRAAFRACVLAARSLRKAANVTRSGDTLEMLAEARLIEAAADDLKAQLVRIVEGEFTPAR